MVGIFILESLDSKTVKVLIKFLMIGLNDQTLRSLERAAVDFPSDTNHLVIVSVAGE